MKASNLDNEFIFLKFPSKEEIKEKNILFSRWGYFENWDSYRNYIFAKNNANLQEETIETKVLLLTSLKMIRYFFNFTLT